MKLQYDTGPERVNMGAAGEFRRGEAREVPDELAAGLLKKETIKSREVGTRPTPTSRNLSAISAQAEKKED